MTTFNFDQEVKRKSTNCKKWDSVQEVFGSEVLPFWIADMDFTAPPAVVEALVQAAQHGVYGYPRLKESFYSSICNWVGQRHNWEINPEWLVLAPGVVTSISAAILTLTQPGDEIIIQTPVYPPFFHVITDNDRRVVENPLRRRSDGYYEMDFDDLEAKLTSKVKAFLLCSPHNPVGRVWRKDELERLYALCAERNIVVISDEIHCDLVYSGQKHVPLASLQSSSADKIITLMAPSKTFNIAGLHCSYLIVPDRKLRKQLQRFFQALDMGKSNVFGLAAAEAAYTEGRAWLDELIPYLEGNGDLLVQFIQEKLPKLQVVKPEATYLAWLDCSSLKEHVDSIPEFFVQQARLGLNPGGTFGTVGEGFMRLNFGCPRPMLQQGLKQLEQAVKGLTRS